MKINDTTFVYFYPFSSKCISCSDHLQGRVIVSWKGIYYCPTCALSASLIEEHYLMQALDKTEGQIDKIEEQMLQRLA